MLLPDHKLTAMTTVMIIDDDAEDIEYFIESIKALMPDCNCLTAESCEDAMKLLNEGSAIPDRIFLDGMLYGMTSIECLRRFKRESRLKSVGVIIYSGYLPDALHQQYIEQGAELFLPKPNSRKELQEALRKIFNI